MLVAPSDFLEGGFRANFSKKHSEGVELFVLFIAYHLIFEKTSVGDFDLVGGDDAVVGVGVGVF